MHADYSINRTRDQVLIILSKFWYFASMSNILAKYFERVETISFDCRVGVGKAEYKTIGKVIIKGKDAWYRSFVVNIYFFYWIVVDDVPKLQEVSVSNQKKGVFIE